jgi:hypothetical protein
MPVLILLGWLVGLVLGGVAIAILFVALGLSLPFALSGLAGILTPLVAALAVWVAVLLALLFLALCFLLAYLIATASIAPTLPTATGLPAVTFPLPRPLATPAGVAVTIPATPGEFFARGLMIGLSAASNSFVLSLIPLVGGVLAGWAFIVISLTAIIFVARNRFFQGFLGWSGWLFPLSYFATAVGLLLFIVNIPFAFAAFGIGAFAMDWTTGVIETNGGITGITGFSGGFSLGNFTFLAGPIATATPALFTVPSTSSHETGHSLNTSAFGGIVLWINAIDENVLPTRINLAYGELTAEGHSRNMPGTPTADYSLRIWF